MLAFLASCSTIFGMDQGSESALSTTKSESSLSLSVLRVISEARSANGLRLQDPVRYTTYCAKRILSLKKSLKFIQKSKKAPPKPITTELVTQDIRYPRFRRSGLTRGTLKLFCFLQNGLGVKVQA